MIKTKKIFNWILTGISLSYLLVILSPSFLIILFQILKDKKYDKNKEDI